MGKKEKDKSKKYEEIREIVRAEIENVLQKLSLHVQFGINTQTEEAPTEETTEETTDQQPTEEQNAANTDAPAQEKT